MPKPKVVIHDQLAKSFFKRKASTAIAMGICVACKAKVRLLHYTQTDRVDEYEEYKTDGLCIACNDELNGPIVFRP